MNMLLSCNRSFKWCFLALILLAVVGLRDALAEDNGPSSFENTWSGDGEENEMDKAAGKSSQKQGQGPSNRIKSHAGSSNHVITRYWSRKNYNSTIHVDKTACHLDPWESDINSDIMLAKNDGVDLVILNILFPEYNSNPLHMNSSYYFRADRSYRVFTDQGADILRLPFNYVQLSAGTLRFNTRNLSVQVVDAPVGCYGLLSESEKINVLMQLLLADFALHVDSTPWENTAERICYQTLANDSTSDYIKLTFQCCHKVTSDFVHCAEITDKTYLTVAHIFTIVVEILFMLLAPLLFVRTCFSTSPKSIDYVIPLENDLHKTLLIKRVYTSPSGDSTGQSKPKAEDAGQPEARQFRHFRELVKSIPSDSIVSIVFRQLHITVDGGQLATAGGALSVYGGLWRCLYDSVCLCSPLASTSPVNTCCAASIFGTWSTRFLWFKLSSKPPDCSAGSCRYCAWINFARIIGMALLLSIVLLPYGLRLLFYYLNEQDEMDARDEFAEKLGAKLWPQDSDIFHFISPTSFLPVAVYIALPTTFILIIFMRLCGRATVDRVVLGSLGDLRRLAPSNCLRLFVSHLLLPFEKFGVCGLLVAIIYWPIILPVCLLITLFYSIPLVYLTGRFLLGPRPAFLRVIPSCCKQKRKSVKSGSLSTGTTSLEHCLCLDRISPNNSIAGNKSRKQSSTFFEISEYISMLCSYMLSMFIGMLCVTFMYAVILLYTECVGFFTQIILLTVYGVFQNAKKTSVYLVLICWFLVYSVLSFMSIYRRYNKANSFVFNYMFKKLGSQLHASHLKKNRFAAFKIPSAGVMKDGAQNQTNVRVDLDAIPDHKANDNSATTAVTNRKISVKAQTTNSDVDDVVEDKQGKLQWRLHSVALFLDNGGVLRIPLALSRSISVALLGKLSTNILKTVFIWLATCTYLALLAAVMVACDLFDSVATPYQLMMAILIGALPLPFLLRTLCFNMNTSRPLSEAKIDWIINNFVQSWPVQDLLFDVIADATPEDTTNNTADNSIQQSASLTNKSRLLKSNSESTSMSDRNSTCGGQRRCKEPPLASGGCTNVDLFFTIRDEPAAGIENRESHGLNSSAAPTSLARDVTQTSTALSQRSAEERPIDTQPRHSRTVETLPKQLDSLQESGETQSKVVQSTADTARKPVGMMAVKQDRMAERSVHQENQYVETAAIKLNGEQMGKLNDGTPMRITANLTYEQDWQPAVGTKTKRTYDAHSLSKQKSSLDSDDVEKLLLLEKENDADRLQRNKTKLDVKEKVPMKDKFISKKHIVDKDDITVEHLPSIEYVNSRDMTASKSRLSDDTMTLSKSHVSDDTSSNHDLYAHYALRRHDDSEPEF